MVLKAALADKMQQLLQFRNLNHARAAEGVERVVGESSFSNVAAHLPASIIGGEARKAHLLRLDEPDAGSEGIFFTHGAGNNLLKIHLHGTEEMFRQIRAVEADCLVGVRSVVIVPVEKSRGRAGGELQW